MRWKRTSLAFGRFRLINFTSNWNLNAWSDAVETFLWKKWMTDIIIWPCCIVMSNIHLFSIYCKHATPEHDSNGYHAALFYDKMRKKGVFIPPPLLPYTHRTPWTHTLICWWSCLSWCFCLCWCNKLLVSFYIALRLDTMVWMYNIYPA